MEVFHDPTLRQNTLKKNESVRPIEFSQVNEFGCIKRDDGNDMMRQRIREKDKKPIEEDLAVRTVTPFEQGGLNLNQSDTDITNYLNL